MSDSVFERHDGLALAELVRTGQTTATELLDEAIERVEAADVRLNVLADRYHDFAREQIARGLPDGPFHGVPFLRKDEGAEIAGLSSTAGLKLLKDRTAPETRVLAQRYLDAGVVIFGSTTVPPFCVTIDTDRAPYGACRNPWNDALTPGGSSSGSAAVVGGGTLPMAHGNDGGGSLRIPAAWSGAFTVKPSRGRLPGGPVQTEDWLGFATEGTITRSVRDCAAMMDATMGRETGSRYVAPQPERSYLAETERECRPLRIAVMHETHAGDEFHPHHRAAVHDTADLLSGLGHRVELAAPKIDIDALSIELYKTVAVSVCNVVDDIGKSMGREIADDELEVVVRTLRRRGRSVTGQEYARINDLSMEAAFRFDQFLQDYDLLLSPTMAEPPLPIGEIYRHEDDYDAFRQHQDRYLNMTMVQNVTGQPAMSVPLCWSPDGLPIGMMFVARYGDESTLFALASQLEKARPWWDRRPE